MFKKSLIIYSILATGSQIAIAGDMGKAPVKTHGYSFGSHGYTYQVDPYVGLSIGPRIDTTGNPFVYGSIQGTLSAGLSHLWEQQRFYLAGEAFVGDSTKIKTAGTFGARILIRNFQTGLNYGFDIIPGMMFKNDILAYLRLGVVNTSFSVDSNIGTMNLNKTGWRAGIGLQTNVYKKLDARVEYILSEFKAGNNGNANSATPALFNHEYSNQVNVGLVYKFG